MSDFTAPLAHRTRWDLLPLWEWQYDRALQHAIRSPAQSSARRYHEARARLYWQLLTLLAPSDRFWRTVARLPGTAHPKARPTFSGAALRQWLADRRTTAARLQHHQVHGPPLAAKQSAELEATEVVLAEVESDARACAAMADHERLP